MKIVCVVVFLTFIIGVLSNCGCLKCNPHLHVTHHSHSPIKIIYKDSNYCECPKKVPYTIEVPEEPQSRPLRYIGYNIEEPKVIFPERHCHESKLDLQLQVPVQPLEPVVRYSHKPDPYILGGLIAKPDRVVLQSAGPCSLPRELPDFEEYEGHAPCERCQSCGCGCGQCSCRQPCTCGRRCCRCRSPCRCLRYVHKIALVGRPLRQNFVDDMSSKEALPNFLTEPPQVDTIQFNASVTTHDNSGEKTVLWTTTLSISSPENHERKRTKRDVHWNSPYAQRQRRQSHFPNKDPATNKIFRHNKPRLQDFLQSIKERKRRTHQPTKRYSQRKEPSPFWSVEDLHPPEVQASFLKPVERSQKWEDSQLTGVPKWWQREPVNDPQSLEQWWTPRRFKRSLVEDETMLPFYESDEEIDLPTKKSENGNILEFLGSPLKYFNQLNPFAKKVEGSDNALPKMLGASTRFFTEFLRTFGKDAWASLLINKRNRPLPKRRFARNSGDERMLDEYVPDEGFIAESGDVFGAGSKRHLRRKRQTDASSYDEKSEVREFLDVKSDPQAFLRSTNKTADDFPAERKKRENNATELTGRAITDAFNHFFGGVFNFPQNKTEHVEKLTNTSTAEEDITTMYVKTNEMLRDWEVKAQNVHIQSLKRTIEQASSDIKDLQDRDNDLRIYNDLAKLDTLKNELAEKIVTERERTFEMLKDVQELKEKTTRVILGKLHESTTHFLEQAWIKPLIQLQKLHCAVNKLAQKLTFGQIDANHLAILRNIRLTVDDHNQNVEHHLKMLHNLVNTLKKILVQGDPGLIRRQASILWEVKNIEKLQRVTIEELNKRVPNMRKRKEMKILFDLYKQYRDVEDKQRRLMEEVNL